MADSDAGDAAASSEINGVIAPADIHILIVEDDPVTRRIVKKFVTKCDYQATAVGDGNTALDLMRSDPEAYSLVLSDVRMPSMSGLELLRHIRQDAVLRNIPIIMMSNTDQTEMAYQCLQEGADDYMLKPIRLDYIKGIWRNVWRKRRENAKSLLLEEEKRKRLEMEEAIGSLQERVSEAIETPLTIIIKTIADMMKGANLTEEVKDTMGVVLQQLQSSSLYEPAFANLMNDTSVDDETKSWLQTQVNMGTTSVRDLESLQIHELRTSPATVAGDTEFNTDPEEVAETIAALREIQFDCWNIDEERMTFNIVCMMQDLGLIDRFSIDMPTLLNFINELRRCYDDNPYHNFRHAFDVTQMAYWLLVSGGALEWLSSLDVLVLVLASLCHDVRHPGTNNVFQVNTESRLALLYNDQSVLEMYHTCTAFEILRRPDCNIIAALTRDEYKEFRSLCIKSILATDLQRHVEIVSKFDAIVANFNKNALEDRALLLQVVIKAADISNPLRPFMIARLWSDMIIEEGFRQGEKEAQLGLPISPFMDRHTCNQAKMSVGFLDFLVIPLYSSIARLLPRCEICVDLLKNNRYRWSALLNETGAAGGAGAPGGAASHSHDHHHDHDGHDHGGGGGDHHHHGEAATSKPSKSE